ncbi:MAG: hypothetical protein IPG89_20505 [Bacteroidetes bacterium]|nr:hypothetical protein [Bacteroidota bacterium]
MRHSGLCDTCQRKIKKGGLNKKDSKIFDDLISLLDVLSKNSRWSKSVLNSDQIINIPKVKTVLSSKQKDIINVLIASPSDAYLEREILLKKLERKWTHRYEELTGYRIICHGWEEIASQSGYPQDVLNDLILPKIDIVLGVLRHKLGTPTVNPEGEVRAESGTAEEIYYAIEKNSEKVLCMLYCFATPPNPFFNAHDFEIIRRDYLEVEGFKIRIEKKVVLKLYDDENNLLSLVVEDLLDNITEKFRK